MLFFLDIKEYDTKGNLITRLTDGAHNVTKFYYDHEQLVGVEFPDGSKRAAAFDNLNRQAWAVDERGVTVTNTYDAASRLIRAQYLAWPGEGSLPAMACMPSAALNTSSFSCDTGAIYPTNSLNYSIVYLYDAVGNITNLSDWTGTTVYDYDSLNRCTSENIQHTALLNSLAFQKDFGYNIIDSRTNLTLELDGNTYCTTYDYDMLERLSNIVCSITSLNPISANYAYNPNGKLAGITRRNDGNVVAKTTYGYDTEQRLTSLYTTNAINSNMGLNYTYYAYADSQSRYATNQYSYDNRDQLVNERGGMPGHIFTNQFFYDQAQSRVMSVAGLGEAGSVSTDTYFYALANKLIARDTAFQFDNDGLDVSEELYHGTDPCNNDTDNDGWLDNYEIYTSNTNPWDPDTDGDRTVDGSDAQPFTPNSGLWFGATAGQLPHYWWTTSPSKPVYNYQAQATHKYYYDTAGNLASNIENGEVVHYFYNAQNKLTKIQGSGFTYELIYDSQNRRLGIKKGSQWLYDMHDGTIPIARMNVNGTLSNYFVRGVGIAEGTGDVIAEIRNESETLTPYHYIANHRGDTVLCLDNSDTVVAHIQYDAFGNIVTNICSFTPLYTFSTKEHLPEINAMLYAYRIYLIDCGRWTQRDPIDYQDSVNLYQFCGINSVNAWDPDGQNTWTRVFGGFQAIAGTAEAAVGITFGTVTSPTVAGGIVGAAVAAHGVDNIQAGIRQAWSGNEVDTYTSQTMQGFGMSREYANFLDTGITIAGSLGLGLANGLSLGKGTITVSRWGSQPLKSGDWVMKGSPTILNYIISGKCGPSIFHNEYASYSTGMDYIISSSSLDYPSGLEAVKALLNQAKYVHK